MTDHSGRDAGLVRELDRLGRGAGPWKKITNHPDKDEGLIG